MMGEVSSLSVVPYSEELAGRQVEFAARMWPGKGRRKNDFFLRWKFRGNAKGAVEGILLAVSGDGTVVGQLGLIPGAVRYGSEIRACQWACDLMVDVSMRRRGIASMLFQEAFQRKVITLGSSPSPSAAPTMRRLGFSVLTGPWTMVCPLDPAAVLAWKLPKWPRLISVLGLAARPATHLLQWRLWARSAGKGELLPWQSVQERIAEIEQVCTLPVAMRDREWLNWRCEGLEGFNERMKGILAGKRSFAVVGRMGRYFRIYDWWAEDFASCAALMVQAYEAAARSESKLMTALAQDEQEKDWLRSLGFFAMRTRIPVMVHPPNAFPGATGFRYALYDSDGDL